MGAVASIAGLELKLVGPLQVLRGGREVALPASRKTRALLAFLAMERRPVRRDHLCELLWDLPDDPRGALRWSLSKLRPIVDDPGLRRLVAGPDAVQLNMTGASLDAETVSDAARRLPDLSLEELRRAAAIRGVFAEGLELPRCERFQAWLLLIREDVCRRQAALLAALAERGQDEEAVAAARGWVELLPFDGAARDTLVRLLEREGRHAEAEGQRRLALEKLEEGGVAIPPGLRRSVAVVPPLPALQPAPARTEQQIRFCTAADGIGLAWSQVGQGPPLVKTANWLNHLEHDWDSPVWRHWIDHLSSHRTLIRYDERGNGLSDWDAPELTFDSFVDDLASVADAAGLERFDLLGISQGCAVAVAYAVRHPGRIRRMVLYGGYAAGWRARGEGSELVRRTAMVTLMRDGWGQNNPAFRQVYTTLFFPDASQAEMDWFNELQRLSTSPANAERLSLAFGDIDVRPILTQVSVPTLVLHAREDAVVPYEVGRALATGIPDARFVTLDSRNHLLLGSEPAWARFTGAMEAFLEQTATVA